MRIKYSIQLLLIISLLFYSFAAKASLLDDLQNLQKTYPTFIKAVSEHYITWSDGTQMSVQSSETKKTIQEKLTNPSLADQIQVNYPLGNISAAIIMHTKSDPGRIRYEPFFEKMYGYSEDTVRKNLVTIYWMPHVFGKTYPLEVTTVNGIDKKFQKISDELEKLPRSYYKFLTNPGGTFLWRKVAGADYLSPHSYGIAIDINPDYSDYWRWDLERAGQPINEDAPLTYHNQIPWKIVEIFQKNGFIWGGKWYHYDTMHFEYRPELIIPNHK